MCADKRQRGRPRIYESEAVRKQAERARTKLAGCKEIRLSVPEEYKILFDKFCAQNNLSKVEGLCYLLDLHYNNLSD